MPGAVIIVEESDLIGDAITLRMGERKMTMGRSAAAKILVGLK